MQSADIMDNASQSVIDFENHCIRAHQSKQAIHSDTASSVKYCIDCDCEIPERRKQAMPKAIRCVRCQEIYDQDN